jgi:hypothetical protein
MSDVKRVMWCDIDQDQDTGGPLADEYFVLASDYDALRAQLAAVTRERDALKEKLTAITGWLDREEPSVWRRGIWDAIVTAESS